MNFCLLFGIFIVLLFIRHVFPRVISESPERMQKAYTNKRFEVATPVPIERHPSDNHSVPNSKEQGWHEDDDDDYEDRDGRDDRDMDDEEDYVTEVSQPRHGTDWDSYYDFLITEGSYKFWSVFQLGTAALLLYSGFAALQYAKENPPEADYDDYYWRRRRRTTYDIAPQERSFFGLEPQSFQRILDAVAKEIH